jgi:uncharacterized membrane-anchored protein YjiN (DUF445 family)
MQLVADEAVKQRQLDTMKRRATALLAVATVVFVAARYIEVATGSFWMGALRATAEAAMVGGLADWFAVTALFRHPMGIPIPHTAIVPTRKDRVGRTLGAFVQRNFLSREVIENRLRTLRVAERLAEWLASPENARTISRHLASAMASAAQMVPDDEVERIIGGTVATRVRAVRVTPLLSRLLGVLTEGNRHQELLSEVLQVATRVITDNRALIRRKIEEESPWWLPTSVDEKIYVKIVTAIERTMSEIERDTAHPLRGRFDHAVRRFMERLENSPEMARRVEEWKEEMLATDTAKRFSGSLWIDGKGALTKYAENPADGGEFGGAVEQAITTFGEKVLTDPELLAKVDAVIVDVAVALVARYQDEVADLIAHTVASWDPAVTSKRVELAIGRDLQFIRINGTLVGGLAGLVLYLMSNAW